MAYDRWSVPPELQPALQHFKHVWLAYCAGVVTGILIPVIREFFS
jgi:hypothetical protein